MQPPAPGLLSQVSSPSNHQLEVRRFLTTNKTNTDEAIVIAFLGMSYELGQFRFLQNPLQLLSCEEDIVLKCSS